MGNKGGKQKEPPASDDAVGVQIFDKKDPAFPEDKRDPTGNPSEPQAGTPVKSKNQPENVQSSSNVSSSDQNQKAGITTNQEEIDMIVEKQAEEQPGEVAYIAVEGESKRNEPGEIMKQDELTQKEEEDRKKEEAEEGQVAAEEEGRREEVGEIAKEGESAEEGAQTKETEERARQEQLARVAAEVEEAKRKQEEEARRKEAEERARIAAEEERKRKEAEELAKQQELARIAAEEERKKKEAEELAKRQELARIAEEEERKKKEAEAARVAAEEERKREEAEEIARQEELARVAAEEERKREEERKLAAEEEAERKRAEELARQQAKEEAKREEEERARIQAEEEAARKLAEEEAKRKEAEAIARKQADEEAARKQAEEAERIRVAEAQAREAQEQARLAMLHAEEAQKASQLAAAAKEDISDDTGGDQIDDNPSDLVGGDQMNLPDEPYMKENSDPEPTIESKETAFKFSEDTVKKEVQPLEKMDSMEPPRQSIIVVTPPTGDTSAAQKIAINFDEEPSEKPAAGDVAWDTYMQRRDPGVSPRVMSRRKSATREAPPAPIEPPPTLKEDESHNSNKSTDKVAWDVFMQNRSSAGPRQSVGRRKSQKVGIPPGEALLEESTSPALNSEEAWDALMRNRAPSSPLILSKRKSNRRRRSSSGSKSKEIKDPTLKFRQFIAARGPVPVQSPTADAELGMRTPDALTSTDLMAKTTSGGSNQDVAWEAFINNRGSGTSPRVQSKRKSALLQQNGALL